jgi:hypothetical protein
MLHCEDRSPFTQINAALRKRLNQEKIEITPGISKIKIASVSFSTRSTLDAPWHSPFWKNFRDFASSFCINLCIRFNQPGGLKPLPCGAKNDVLAFHRL